MLEPLNDSGRRLGTIWLSRLERLRAGFEPLRPADETKIQKRALGVFARARLRPSLLFAARAGRIDAKADARAGGEIDDDRAAAFAKATAARRSFTRRREALCHRCGVESHGCGVESHRRADQEPISNQYRHATHARLQSARLRKQAGLRGLPPEQCRNFV